MSYKFNPFTGNFDDSPLDYTSTGTFQAHVTATGESVHGLGNASILDTGTAAGTVATGDHVHDSTYLKLDCSNDPLTSDLEVQGSGTFGGSVTGMSVIASGLTVNNSGGGGANDDFIAKTDNYAAAFQVDASADAINVTVPTTFGTTTKALFRDSAIYIQSADDGHLDLVADTSIDLNANVDVSAKNVITDTTTGTKIGTATTQKLGLWNVTPIVQPATAAYTADDESVAYTGIDNAQAGTVYAQLTDLNALRTAYETIRASYDDLLAKLKTTGIVS